MTAKRSVSSSAFCCLLNVWLIISIVGHRILESGVTIEDEYFFIFSLNDFNYNMIIYMLLYIHA